MSGGPPLFVKCPLHRLLRLVCKQGGPQRDLSDLRHLTLRPAHQPCLALDPALALEAQQALRIPTPRLQASLTGPAGGILPRRLLYEDGKGKPVVKLVLFEVGVREEQKGIELRVIGVE